MNCGRIDGMLEVAIENRLSPADRRLVETHLAHCRRCRELWELARGSLGLPPIEAPEDLTGSILERTTGSPCIRARELLCSWIDGESEGLDGELIRLHVEHCPGCGALAATIARLGEDLAPLAELVPRAGFVSEVLAATVAAPARRHRWTARAVAAWNRSLQRPRFAWEFAYVGALVILLVFGTPGSPLRGAPSRALELLQPETVRGVAGPEGPIGLLGRRVTTLGREALERTPIESLSAVPRNLTSRYQRTSEARRALKLHGEELSDAAARLDFERGTTVLRQLKGDVGSIVTGFVSGGPEPGDEDESPTDTKPGSPP